MIFCPTVSTGAFVARRNGRVFLTGNSGFPKSLDVSKAIDREAGAERETIRVKARPETSGTMAGSGDTRPWIEKSREVGYHEVAGKQPVTPAARQWAGWGTALKPALEPITVARKPLDGTVAETVLAHGTGAINVDGCRVEAEDGYTENAVTPGVNTARTSYEHRQARRTFEPSTSGRWPANLIHDGSDEVVALFPETRGSKPSDQPRGRRPRGMGEVGERRGDPVPNGPQYDDNGGSAARFFYCAKASKADRNSGGVNSTHPTVKPTDLMRYLCRLVTPPGGLVLDPFMGSGSTGKAAVLEGFRFVGIEREAEYVEIARARIEAVTPATDEPTKAPALDDAQLSLL